MSCAVKLVDIFKFKIFILIFSDVGQLNEYSKEPTESMLMAYISHLKENNPQKYSHIKDLLLNDHNVRVTFYTEANILKPHTCVNLRPIDASFVSWHLKPEYTTTYYIWQIMEHRTFQNRIFLEAFICFHGKDINRHLGQHLSLRVLTSQHNKSKYPSLVQSSPVTAGTVRTNNFIKWYVDCIRSL